MGLETCEDNVDDGPDPEPAKREQFQWRNSWISKIVAVNPKSAKSQASYIKDYSSTSSTNLKRKVVDRR